MDTVVQFIYDETKRNIEDYIEELKQKYQGSPEDFDDFLMDNLNEHFGQYCDIKRISE